MVPDALPFRYRPLADRFDEAVAPSGDIADAWRTVVSGFAGVDDDRLGALRVDAARRDRLVEAVRQRAVAERQRLRNHRESRRLRSGGGSS